MPQPPKRKSLEEIFGGLEQPREGLGALLSGQQPPQPPRPQLPELPGQPQPQQGIGGIDAPPQPQLQPQVQPQVQPQPQPQVGGDGFRLPGPPNLLEVLKNIPGSGARFVGDISQLFAHPIQTAKGIGGVALGGVQKLIPGRQAQEETFEQVGQFFRERYGSGEAIVQTIEQDPIGFLADVSALFAGAGGALRGVGAVSRAGQLTRAGQVAGRVGQIAEPIGLGVRGVGAVTRPVRGAVGTLATEALGISTGMGGDVVRQAFRAGVERSTEFRQALRGKIEKPTIVTITREGLQGMKTQRGNAYRAKFQGMKEATQKIPIDDLKGSFRRRLKDDFNVDIGKGDVLDFSKSTIADVAEQKRIQAVAGEFLKWDDSTALGLDTLKRRLDDFYTPSGEGRSLVAGLRKNVKKKLADNVGGYEGMVSEYQKATELIKEIEKTIANPRATIDSSLRKLMSAMKSDPGIKQDLLRALDEVTTGQDIRAAISGAVLSEAIPTGLIGRQIFAGLLTGGGLSLFLRPDLLPMVFSGIAISSPRVVGEFMRALGASKGAADKVVSGIRRTGITSPEARQAAFQAGRMGEQAQPRQKRTLDEIFGGQQQGGLDFLFPRGQ